MTYHTTALIALFNGVALCACEILARTLVFATLPETATTKRAEHNLIFSRLIVLAALRACMCFQVHRRRVQARTRAIPLVSFVFSKHLAAVWTWLLDLAVARSGVAALATVDSRVARIALEQHATHGTWLHFNDALRKAKTGTGAVDRPQVIVLNKRTLANWADQCAAICRLFASIGIVARARAKARTIVLAAKRCAATLTGIVRQCTGTWHHSTPCMALLFEDVGRPARLAVRAGNYSALAHNTYYTALGSEIQ